MLSDPQRLPLLLPSQLQKVPHALVVDLQEAERGRKREGGGGRGRDGEEEGGRGGEEGGREKNSLAN